MGGNKINLDDYQVVEEPLMGRLGQEPAKRGFIRTNWWKVGKMGGGGWERCYRGTQL